MPFIFNRTREQIATLVLGKLGVLAAGATPTSADSELVFEAIDLRLKEIHRLGIFWRKVDKTPLSFTISAGVASASASADVLLPISMHIVSGSADEPVTIIGVKQFAALENKAEGGTPTKVLWEGGAKFKFWPIPTADTTAKLTYEKYADDTSSGSVVDLDVSMLRSFRDMVCYDLGDHYGRPDQTMIRWRQEAMEGERNIRKLGSERVDFVPVAVDEFDPYLRDYPA